MKKYIVVRVYETMVPTAVFSTDIFEDAKAYADIMHRTDGYPYTVLTQVNYND